MKKLYSVLIAVLALNFLMAPSRTAARYVERKETDTNTFTVKCWAKPVLSTALSPASDSFTNVPAGVLSWEPATSSCRIAQLEYRIELYGERNNTSAVLASSDWSNMFRYGMPELKEGAYAWRLSVRDQYGNTTTPPVMRFIVDSTAPDVGMDITGSPVTRDDTKAIIFDPRRVSIALTGTDASPGAGLKATQFRMNGGEWQDGSTLVLTGSGKDTVEYRAVDNAGNQSSTRTIDLITDYTAPVTIANLTGTPTDTTVTLNWAAPVDDNPANTVSAYELRYATTPLTDASWNTATPVSGLPSPGIAGTSESVMIGNLQPNTTYYFAIRSKDAADNYSSISNSATVKTLAGRAFAPQEVILNEVYWAGTDTGNADWIELRNSTGADLDLSGLVLKMRLDGGERVIPVDFTGKKIPADGYFVIAGSGSAVTDKADVVIQPFDLSGTQLLLELYDATGALIDSAGNGTTPFAGDQTHSMERITAAKQGYLPEEWRQSEPNGSPKSMNATARKPEVKLELDDISKKLSFVVSNVKRFVKLNYILSYTHNEQQEGITGESDLTGQDLYRKDGITVGTCSSGTCVFHEMIKNLKLQVTVTAPDGTEETVETGL